MKDKDAVCSKPLLTRGQRWLLALVVALGLTFFVIGAVFFYLLFQAPVAREGSLPDDGRHKVELVSELNIERFLPEGCRVSALAVEGKRLFQALEGDSSSCKMLQVIEWE